METQILEFTDESVEDIEERINEFIPHYEIKDVEVVSRGEGFLVMVFYEE
jgi:hypothetical protein